MTQIEVDNKLVKKVKFHLAGEDGEMMWIEFETEGGEKIQTYYFKGGI